MKKKTDEHMLTVIHDEQIHSVSFWCLSSREEYRLM